MLTEHQIETEWEVAKLLVNPDSYKMLLYILPKYDLYLQSLQPITLRPLQPQGTRIYFRSPSLMHIATVRTQNTDNVVNFILSEPRFKASRIFKHGFYKSLEEDKIIGLVANTAKNMLGLEDLVGNPIFRITSLNKELRDLFYRMAVKFNEEDNFGCGFDYDKYDYTLDIRVYKRFATRRDTYIGDQNLGYTVVTILYGSNLYNYWNMKKEKV